MESSMNKVEGILKKEKFQVIEGGKDGNYTPPSDWLTPLPNDTYFRVVEKNTDNPMTQDFLKISPTDTKYGVEIIVNPKSRVNGQFNIAIVDPIRFCKIYSLFEILIAEEAEDAHSDENSPGDMAGANPAEETKPE